jgi:hypothetical protein
VPPSFLLDAAPSPATKEKQQIVLDALTGDPRLGNGPGQVELLWPSADVVRRLVPWDHIHLDLPGYNLLAQEAVAQARDPSR